MLRRRGAGQHTEATETHMPYKDVWSSSVVKVHEAPCHVETNQVVDADESQHNVGPLMDVGPTFGGMEGVIHELYAHQAQEESDDVEVDVHEHKALYDVHSADPEKHLRKSLSFLICCLPPNVVVVQD